jgi:hypothetical protein
MNHKINMADALDDEIQHAEEALGKLKNFATSLQKSSNFARGELGEEVLL